MPDKPGFDVVPLPGPALAAQVDLLAFTTLGEPSKDPVFKSVDHALGGALADVARAEGFEGKPGQQLALHTHGKLAAKRVLVLGAGPRGELAPPHLRDLTASIAQHANRVGAAQVGFVLPALGASREPALIQMVVEGLYLGTYRFARYLTSEEARKPQALTRLGLFLDAKGKKLTAAAPDMSTFMSSIAADGLSE